jgi:hypothetical protein
MNTPAATMRFITIVEKDYAIIHINATAFYVGALTDLIVPGPGIAAAVPIGIVDLFNSGYGVFGGLTRHPIAAADAPLLVALSHSLSPFNGNNMPFLQRLAFNTALYLNPDRFQGNRVSASEIAAIMQAATYAGGANNAPAKVGALRGKFKALRVTTYPFAAAVYDTIVVDGRKHIILLDKAGLSGTEFITPINYSNQVHWGFVCDTGVVAP